MNPTPASAPESRPVRAPCRCIAVVTAPGPGVSDPRGARDPQRLPDRPGRARPRRRHVERTREKMPEPANVTPTFASANSGQHEPVHPRLEHVLPRPEPAPLGPTSARSPPATTVGATSPTATPATAASTPACTSAHHASAASAASSHVERTAHRCTATIDHEARRSRRTRSEPHVAAVEAHEHRDRRDVVGDREGEQEDPQSRGRTGRDERQRAERERDVGRHRDAPTSASPHRRAARRHRRSREPPCRRAPRRPEPRHASTIAARRPRSRAGSRARRRRRTRP